jgi:streptomycin 6-kinase
VTRARPTLAEVRRAWHLDADGTPFATASSLLQFVRTEQGDAAVLKLARSSEEVRGGRALAGWSGDGAAPVLRASGAALLLLRASGGDLVAQHRRGEVDAALDRIADVAVALQAGTLPEGTTVPLDRWFAALRRLARHRGGSWRAAWSRADGLLESTPRQVPLHGDLHHANVLDFGPLGFRAIDPKALHGDPAFEFATTLLNPDRGHPRVAPPALRRRAERLARRAGVDAERVLAWTEAFTSLSAAWAIEERGDPTVDLAWRRRIRAARAVGQARSRAWTRSKARR